MHPGTHFFLQVPREITHIFAQGNHRPRHQEAVIEALIGHLVQSRCQGKQGFAGAGHAHQCDKGHIGVQQQVKSEGLFAVAGLDAADPGLAGPLQGQ